MQLLSPWLCNGSDHGLFPVFADIMKSLTIKLFIIIITIINIRFWCITMKFSGVKHITIIIMIITIIINIIKSRSITMKLSDIKLLIITIIAIIIKTMKSNSIALNLSVIKFLTNSITIATVIAILFPIISIIKLLFADLVKRLIIVWLNILVCHW